MISVSNKRKAFMLLPFVVLGFLIYSNTFDVPFHFDDTHVVSDLSFKDMLEKCKSGGSRFICHLSFLLNYWLGGTDVFGYHIFNTFIHIGTAYFVFMFLFHVLSISNPKPYNLERVNRLLPPLSDSIFWPAFLGGVLFLVHPFATQSVTYITQRYASLAGFFYIGSLAFFVSARLKFRENERFFTGSHLLLYFCSFIMAVLAMRTKEMAITLPAMVLLTEYYFIQSDFKAAGKRILYLLPLLSTGLIIPVSDMIGIETISLESVAALQDYTWDAGVGISRKEYLFTQFKIIAGIYLKLIVWPIGQNIDHDYITSITLLDVPTLASFVTLCLIVGLGLWLFKRARLVSFGVLWFFITISPTSSIVSNTEFVAEHRAYISLMGLAFAVAGLPTWQTHWKRYLSILLPVLFLLSGLTYARNRVWKTDLTMWEDSAKKSPKKMRPHYNLGVVLAERGRLKEAISHYSKALAINTNLKPDSSTIFVHAHYNLGNALTKQGRVNEAITHYSEALRMRPRFEDAHYNLGLALYGQGKIEEAIIYFFEAIRIKPDYAKAHNNLGVALFSQGKFNEAISHYSEALLIEPEFVEAHYNFGNALAKRQRYREAIVHYSKALSINPDYAEAHNHMGISLYGIGKLEESIAHYFEALRVKPNFVEAHNNLGIALAKQGKFEEAVSHYSEVLRIKPDYAQARRNLELVLRQKAKSAGASKSGD